MSKQPYGIIYMTSRVFRGEVVKRYIGQHRVKFGKVEDNYLGSGKILVRAIEKYGRASFIRETVEVCYSQQELNQAEARWVDHYNAVEDPSFYNLAVGGMSTANLNSRIVYQYTLDGKYLAEFASVRQAAAKTDLSHKSIAKAAVSSSLTVGGYQWRYEFRESYPPVRGTCDRSVECYTPEGAYVRSFSKAIEGALWTGRNFSANLAACCRGERLLFAGYQWRYTDSDKVIVPVSVGHRNKKTVTVITPSGNKLEFDSITKASKEVGTDPATITKAAKLGAVYQGYYWEVKE